MNMYTHTHVCAHTTYPYTSTCIHSVAYVHVHTHTNTRTYMYTQVHVRTHTCDTVMQGLRLMTGSVSTKLPISSWSFFLQKNQLLLSFCRFTILYFIIYDFVFSLIIYAFKYVSTYIRLNITCSGHT